jgi:hypothetical protein
VAQQGTRHHRPHLPIGRAFIAPSARGLGRAGPRVLRAPVQVAPPDGAVFSHYPRTTVLRWRRIPAAVSYTVELDCFQCCQVNQWCTDVGQTWQIVGGLTTNTYTFNWVGAQPGRWRVWATNRRGVEGAKSPWREFNYTV